MLDENELRYLTVTRHICSVPQKYICLLLIELPVALPWDLPKTENFQKLRNSQKKETKIIGTS